jgi:hypothetical protein
VFISVPNRGMASEKQRTYHTSVGIIIIIAHHHHHHHHHQYRYHTVITYLSLYGDACVDVVRMRMASVNVIKKITKAMKMVAAARVKRSQDALEHARRFVAPVESVWPDPDPKLESMLHIPTILCWLLDRCC